MALIVSESRRKGVAYVSLNVSGAASKPTLEPIGTAFFVMLEVESAAFLVYVVTARHCIPLEEDVWLEVGNSKGEPYQIPTRNSEWIRHPTNDIACRRVVEEAHWNVHSYYEPEFVSSAQALHIGSGAPVFMLGLFRMAPFSSKGGVEPIVRFGTVSHPNIEALVYFDAERTKQGVIHSLLVESLSFAGESGSPVFMHFDEVRNPGATGEATWSNIIQDNDVPTPLIGMVSAHWTIESPIRNRRTKNVGTVPLNSGMMVVVPGQDILEFVKTVAMEDNKKLPPAPPRNKPTTPLSSTLATTGRLEFTKEDFEAALKKVSRRIQPLQSDEES